MSKDFNNRKPYTNYAQPNSVKPIVEPIEKKEVISETPVVEEIPVVEEVAQVVEEPTPVIERVDESQTDVVLAVRTVTPQLLNVRVAPNASAPIVRTVAQGTKVNVLEYVDEFAKIGDNEYVNINFLN